MTRNVENLLPEITELLIDCDSKLMLTGNYKRENRRLYFECVCDCGVTRFFYEHSIKRRIKSCGCHQNNHGFATGEKHPLYIVWQGIKARCYYEKHKWYYRYGGRGIKMCEAWHNAGNFIEWAISQGWKKGLEVDRKDNNGNYEPDNCQLLTKSENASKGGKSQEEFLAMKKSHAR